MHGKARKQWVAERARVKKELGCYDLSANKKNTMLDRLSI